MSKEHWAGAAIVLLWLLPAGGAPFHSADPRGPAPDHEADRAAIEKLEHEWLKGESDKATLERILAPDFMHQVSAGVFLSKQQHVDWAVRHPRPADRKTRFEKLDVRLYGDTAIATGIVDNIDASGKNLRRTVFTDVCRRPAADLPRR